ncbi:MAG: hypothetical protein GY696_25580, partial [Gammaproteobacteria bacterium]|nr:hypothetical protein [Gammaproteobacteria bacterium]
MKRSIFNPKCLIAVIKSCFVGICVLASMNLQAKDMQIGRYSLSAATPTEAQANLLVVTMAVKFPKQIQTVGEAVRHLLQGSGYRLTAAELIGP